MRNENRLSNQAVFLSLTPKTVYNGIGKPSNGPAETGNA